MAEIALPRQRVTQEPRATGIGSPLYQRRMSTNAGPIELIPNPDFTFPMRAPETPSSETASTPNTRPMSLQAYPAGRRGSTPGARQKSVNALPDFSFNPAGAEKPSGQTPVTPPHSPLAVPTTPSRAIGHRRGGSEFIGGDGRTGGVNLLSTSPTKGDGVLPAPNANLRPGPPAGRRGHAHRRSGAISSHDLSSIIRGPDPNTTTRGGSAPVTPMEDGLPPFGHTVNKSMSQPSLRNGEFVSDGSNSPRRPPSRARVGFSDKVEYIRPLSTISSETETSLSTVRGHSATGSLSSVISTGTSSPSSTRMGRRSPSLNATIEQEVRPKTAGAVLEKQKQSPFGGDLFKVKRPTSSAAPSSPTAEPSPTNGKFPGKRRGFFRLESRRSDPTVPTLSSSASDPSLAAPALESPLPSPRMTEDEESMGEGDKGKTQTRKGNRKPRKVKSWANSIISRKGKHHKGQDPLPTPPAQVSGEEDDDEEFDFEASFDANFDVDNTVTIVSPTGSSVPQQKVQTDIASWKPRELKRVDSDGMSPVIDLDAALGPFNTPQGSSPAPKQRGFGAHRRAMHSAGGLLQPHRRTESAPELVPFEHRATAIANAGTMADVFEEEEPEEEPETVKLPASPAIPELDEDIEEPKIQVVEAADVHNGSTINWNFDNGLGIKRAEKKEHEAVKAGSVDAQTSQDVDSLQISPKQKGPRRSLEVSPIDVVQDFEEPRASSFTRSSDSTVTPTLAPEETKEAQPVMSLALPLPQSSLMTPDTFASSFSSPDFRSSQASFDTPRLGTSASSVTDYRAMPSPHFGEPGPEVRISVDDVPSLTSSRSTMTSGLPHGFPLMPRRPGDRSGSLCSMPGEFEQVRRKRSSIASLSRLINSSHSFGERSKLSIEQRPQSEYLEPSRQSKKKHKRLSKLINFWKPKDSSRA